VIPDSRNGPRTQLGGRLAGVGAESRPFRYATSTCTPAVKASSAAWCGIRLGGAVSVGTVLCLNVAVPLTQDGNETGRGLGESGPSVAKGDSAGCPPAVTTISDQGGLRRGFDHPWPSPPDQGRDFSTGRRPLRQWRHPEAVIIPDDGSAPPLKTSAGRRWTGAAATGRRPKRMDGSASAYASLEADSGAVCLCRRDGPSL